MATTPKPMPTRSKPNAALKKALASELHATQMLTGTVTAVRWDDTVNVQVGGTLYQGVSCASSYSGRQSGDRVQLILQGGQPFVMGSVGGDDDQVQPDFFPAAFSLFTWGRGNVAVGNDRPLYYTENGLSRIGRPGSTHPTYPGDNYSSAAYSFWDGSTNQLNSTAKTPAGQSIDLFMARDVWDEGDPGPAHLQLVPHCMDALPAQPGSMIYQQSLDPPGIDFTLEAGEQQVITLPDNWTASIAATTLTSSSIRGFSIWPGNTGGPPWALDNSYAILTPLTCAARVYTQ